MVLRLHVLTDAGNGNSSSPTKQDLEKFTGIRDDLCENLMLNELVCCCLLANVIKIVISFMVHLWFCQSVSRFYKIRYICLSVISYNFKVLFIKGFTFQNGQTVTIQVQGKI